MCGIVGYTGPREAGPILIEGLRRLEYRGYDSAGIALVDDAGDLFVEKRAGKLANLQTAIADRTPHAAIGLAHTRWATHGRPNDLNAHPHQDCTGDITVIHNGIIENFRELRDGLEARGHRLTSETDTEAIAHLVEEAYDGRPGRRRPRTPFAQARGRLRDRGHAHGEADRLVGARKDVPLVVGLGDGESFLATDVAAILAHTDRIIFLEEGDVADLRPWGVTITGVDGVPRERAVTAIDWSPEAAEKGGYEHFMLKEIHEQPEALRQCIAGRVDRDDRIPVDELAGLADAPPRGDPGRARRLRQRLLRGAGRGRRAPGRGPGCRPGRPSARSSATARRRSMRADARHRGDPVGRDRRHDRPDPPRARARLPDHRRDEHRRLGDHPRGRRGPVPAGRPGDRGRGVEDVRDPGDHPGHPCRRDRPDPGRAPRGRRARARGGAARPAGGRGPRPREPPMRRGRLARRYVNSRGFMFVGRGATYPAALEGALKLKEVSYVHAEGYAAGELKHGPISLLDAECPLVAVATRSSVYDKLISNVMEGRARDARVIAVATEGDEHDRPLRRRRLLGARHARGAQPGPRDHPAPAVRLPRRGRPGHRRRPAAQPGQVGHGRVARGPRADPTDGTDPGRCSCRPGRPSSGSTSSRSIGSGPRSSASARASRGAS